MALARFHLISRLGLLAMLFVLGAATALTGVQAAGTADRLPPLPANGTILAFGDSLTAGIGGSGESYPQRLELLTGVEVENSGLPGETTAQGRERLPRELAAHRPDLLILCLGINDFLRGVPREQVRDNLRAMLVIADQAAVPVLLLALPQPGSALADPLYTDLGERGRVRVDTQAMVDVLANPALKAGLVHPNREGYRQVAEAVTRTLRASGALPDHR